MKDFMFAVGVVIYFTVLSVACYVAAHFIVRWW
jgi:hypothetical protein